MNIPTQSNRVERSKTFRRTELRRTICSNIKISNLYNNDYRKNSSRSQPNQLFEI